MSCLLCVSFLDRSGVVASIQLDSVLVENAEYGTSASESAGSPDFIYRMSGNIEVHYSLFSVEFLRLAGRKGGRDTIIFSCSLITCSADFLSARTSSGREPIITNTSDGLVSGNRMLLESIRSWMLMMRMTFTLQKGYFPTQHVDVADS